MKSLPCLVATALVVTATFPLLGEDKPAATPPLAAKGGPPNFDYYPENVMRREAEFYTEKVNRATLRKVGEAAPDFTCRTIGGEEFSLSKEKGKVVLLNFMSAWSAMNTADVLRLEKELRAKYPDRKDFKCLTIGYSQGTPTLEQFATEKGIAQSIAPDPDQAIFAKFATDITHRSFVIGKDGKIKLSVGGTVSLVTRKDGKKGPAVTGYTEATFQEISRVLRQELDAPPRG